MDKIYFMMGVLRSFPSENRRSLIKIFLFVLLFACAGSIKAQAPITISGTVRDSKGITLPGVAVSIKGSKTGTTTDINGKYNLKVPNLQAVLIFSSVSFLPQEIKASKTIIDVVLEDNAKNLDEVVVVGYGVQSKPTLTGSVVQINSAQLLTSPTPNATNTLIGKLPGLLTVQTSGQPGADAASLYIRGLATLGNAQAIVVVDGVQRPSIGEIDPNEIETVTVLKDAASTAVYGIKGANGVVVVTTKAGKIGRPKVSYTGNFSEQTYTGLPIGLGAYDNARLLNQAYLNDSKPAPWSAAELQKFQDGSDPYGYPDVQWFKYLTRKYYSANQHNVNVTGGSKVAKYFVSVGSAFQDGIFKKFDSPYGINTVPNYNRYNFRSNVDLSLTKDLTVGIKLGGLYSNRYQPAGPHTPPFAYDTIEGLISRILQVPSYAYPVMLPDGRIAQNPGVGTNLWNPLAVLTRFGTRNDINNTINTTFNVDYKLGSITKGLAFKTVFAYDSYYTTTQQRDANWAAYVWDRTTGNITLSTDTRTRNVPLGGIQSTISGSTNTTLQTGFTYNRSFGLHNVEGLLLANRGLVQGPSDSSNPIFSSPPKATQGIVYRVRYNYDERYLLDFEGSYNGTDNFAPGLQYGFFPAVSAGWTVTKESFFPKNPYLTYLKIKGSYGLVGNDQINTSVRFPFLTSYSSGTAVQFGNLNSPTSYPTVYIASTALGNPQITWETGTKRNIGIESRLFKDQLKLNIDLFDENRKDILITPKSGLLDFGHAYPALNVGKVYNKGYEVELDYQAYVGKVTLGINGQLSYAKNKILNADEPPGTPEGTKLAGKPVGQFFGYVADGFYQSAADIAASVHPAGVIPGDLKFKDLNGDGVINSLDQQAIGYSNIPEYVYSFTPRIAFKGLSITAMFQGAAHVSSNLILNEQNNGQQMYPFMLNAWTPDNAATATWPALHARGYTGLNNALNSFNLQDASYVKLRNVEIAYQLPKSFTDRIKVQGIRIFLNGQNLITWTPFRMYVDPENLNVVNQTFPLQALYPSSRVFNIGANINF